MAAAEILKKVAVVVAMEDGVLAGDLRIGQEEIAAWLPADGKGHRIDIDSSRAVALADYETYWGLAGFHGTRLDAALSDVNDEQRRGLVGASLSLPLEPGFDGPG